MNFNSRESTIFMLGLKCGTFTNEIPKAVQYFDWIMCYLYLPKSVEQSCEQCNGRILWI